MATQKNQPPYIEPHVAREQTAVAAHEAAITRALKAYGRAAMIVGTKVPGTLAYRSAVQDAKAASRALEDAIQVFAKRRSLSAFTRGYATAANTAEGFFRNRKIVPPQYEVVAPVINEIVRNFHDASAQYNKQLIELDDAVLGK